MVASRPVKAVDVDGAASYVNELFPVQEFWPRGSEERRQDIANMARTSWLIVTFDTAGEVL
jgi:hypothetical protein